VIGLATAWTSHRWVGLLPFIFSLAYNAWTSLFLSSGDRFLIPIDWTWYLYYALGLLTLAKVAFSGIENIPWSFANTNDVKDIQVNSSSWQKTALTAGLILFAGVSLPFTELAFPEKYPVLTQEQLSAEINSSTLEDEIILYGRAIYPRYYESGDGEPGTAKLGYGISDEARLVFWLVGPKAVLVIFPLETAPAFFPHTADVWIIGTMEGDVLRARIITVEAHGQTITYGQ
jgi:hypothetical protein